MNPFLKLMMLYVSLFSLFSCSVGAGGGSSSPSSIEITTPTPSPVPAPGSDSRGPATPNLAPASTLTSVKLLQLDSEKFQCGENFSSYLKNNKVGINVHFGENRKFTADVNFYDSNCADLQLAGNKIAKYSVGGDYAVTTLSGTTVLTITSSVLTIYAGDFPAATKDLVGWLNSCEKIPGIFSLTQNTTLSLAPGPDCKFTPEQRFPFPMVGTTAESTENDIRKFIGLTL